MTQHSAKRPAVRARWEVSDTPWAQGLSPLRRFVSQPEHRLQPQPEFWFELDVPPTLLHEPQPHRRQQLQPGEVPPTLPQPPQPQDEPLPCVQVQVHVHVGIVVDVPPTEPEDCLQHGLQHRCWTKSGNIRPLKPLQRQAIAHTSKKISGNIGSRSILCPACAFGVRLCRFSPRWAAQARRRSPAAGSAASAAVS